MAARGERHDITEPLVITRKEEETVESIINHNNEDLEEIKSVKQFLRHADEENKRLWSLAGPAIFTSIAQYALSAMTQMFAGHLATLEFDAVSIVILVISGLAFGIMVGMGSALETLCGQAYGAKQLHMLGIYLQRSWIILATTCILLLPIYIFATPILCLLGQNQEIASLAGKFSLYTIPQLFAIGLNFPIQKFLQSQSKVMVMAVISAIAMVLNICLSWLLIFQFGFGLIGAAISFNVSWWFLVLAQFGYIALGYCPGAWNGFSWLAFKDLGAFARLSIGSGIMLCLEMWFYMFLVLIAGNLNNAQVAVGAIGICMNLNGWQFMIFLGLNAAISVRISNELGAGRPRAAKFSILIVLISAVILGLISFVLALVLRNVYGIPFTNNPEVLRAISRFALIFAFTLFLNSIQPVLSGVAVGAGWQWLVAYINLGCYYLIGVPLGYVMGFPLNLGVKGMWTGLMAGIGSQTLILIFITLRTDWDFEAKQASARIEKWGGSLENFEDNSTGKRSSKKEFVA